MIKKFERVCFIVVIIFAIIGSVVIGTAMHEYSHATDFGKFAKNEEICALVLPKSFNNAFDIDTPLGYYRFEYEIDKQNEVDIKGRQTEKKAYFFTMIPIFLVGIAILTVVMMRTVRQNI